MFLLFSGTEVYGRFKFETDLESPLPLEFAIAEALAGLSVELSFIVD